LLQRGGKRPQEERRGCSGGVLLLFGGGCSGESCSGSMRNSAEKGIPQRASCLVFAPAVFKIRRAPQETGFFAPAVFYSPRAPHGCSALREIQRGHPSHFIYFSKTLFTPFIDLLKAKNFGQHWWQKIRFIGSSFLFQNDHLERSLQTTTLSNLLETKKLERPEFFKHEELWNRSI
jgi:hypothetical protein